jgi:two-component system cell cycle response regulator
MRILIAEDEAVQRRLLESWLTKWGHEVVLAQDGAEAWSILQTEAPPLLAILDWMMPGMNGLQICQELRKSSDRPYVYVLLLTAKSKKQDLLTALEAGADDYLTKPFDTQELRARLETGMRILRLQEQLLFASRHDALTGLLNRRAILEAFEREWARSQREGNCVGLIIADLDHFKKVNDTLGHLEGDTVLRETAQKLRSSIRIYDSVGRYGGEEFLIVLPGCDLRQTREKAERIRILVESELAGNTQRRLPVTASMGVTAGTGDRDTKSLLHAADSALYRAKHKGRNRVEYALVDDVLGDDGFSRKHPLILIVDDEHAHRELLAEYLEQEKFCVAMAASGREAVEQAKELHPDLITLDILMPGRGGFDTLVDLKSGSETANIPVIVISSMDKLKVHFKPDVEEFLGKPVDKLAFIAAVRRHLARAFHT